MIKFLSIVAIAVLLCCAGRASAQTPKPMTNQDVISLVQAKMSDNTIIMAVKGAKPAFDTSADGLIKLNRAGVSEPILQAIIEASAARPASPGKSAPPAPAPSAPRNAFNPEELTLVDGTQQTTMRYLSPQMRTAARAMGFGGVATYAVLRGNGAALRIKNKKPVFLLAVPNNAQAESYYTLASLAERRNGTREIMVGGGYMSYSTGVVLDRVIPASAEKVADQANAPTGFTIYRVTPTQMLNRGEYAMILYNSQVRVTGYFFSGLDSYFDFAIED